jgi:phage tail-like protein
MRGMLAEEVSPSPLEQALPGMFQDDDFACRFVGAFDSVVAPVFAALDNLTAYLDPHTAPPDFLDWLAGWFGLELDATWALERRRDAVRKVVDLYRWRGTSRGLRAWLELQLGGTVGIEEGGGVTWSPTPGADPPGVATHEVLVRIEVPDASAVDVARVEGLARAVTPAHIVCRVEVVGPVSKATKAAKKAAKATKKAADDVADSAKAAREEPFVDGADGVDGAERVEGDDGADGADGVDGVHGADASAVEAAEGDDPGEERA